MADNGTGAAERRVVTALFCDVVGSTTLAETMDPEDWAEVVGEAVGVMARGVERFGGTVAQFAGDGILALFGAPVAHEDDPYRAVRAAADIISSVSNLSDPLEVRVGINTGLVLAGEIGAGKLNLYSALGDAANVAARLQGLASPGHIVISGETRALVANDIDVREIGPTELKGRAEPVEVYEVTAVRGSEERRRGVPGLSSPMLGRDRELDLLGGLVTMAAAGTGRVAVILGEPGVGKTRLTAELAERVAGDGAARWAVGTCVPYDEDLPFHLLSSLIHSLAGVTSSDDPDVIAKAVGDLTDEVGHPEAAEPLLHMLGVGGMDQVQDAERLHATFSEAVFAVVAAVAIRHSPVVLVCEDAHWADPSSVELMSGLLERAPSTPVVLLIVMRPDRDSGGWRLLTEARQRLAESLTEIELSPLDDSDSRQIVGHLLAIESLPSRLRDMVLNKAEGNPFFLEEVVRMLIERGVVEERAGRWVATEGIERLEVPATLHGLLASRIDLLPAEVRSVGRVAAVIGRQFPAKLVARVHHDEQPEEGTTLDPHIAALEAQGMVTLAGTRPVLEFSFRHALIHDVMYEGLPKRERRRLHRAVAEAIEELHAERTEEVAPALARHFAEAGDAERAIGYLLISGRGAVRRGANSEAYRFYCQAVRLASPDTDPERWLDAAIGQARSGSTFTPGPQAIPFIQEAIPVAEKLDDPDRLAQLYIELLTVRNMSGESYATSPYREELDAAYALVPRLTSPGVKALVQGMMGLAHKGADEYGLATAELSESVAGLEAARHLSQASFQASMLADAYASLGAFDKAEQAVEEAARIGAESGDPNAILDADLIKGRIASERGDLVAALEHAHRGLAAADEVGNTFCSLAGNFLVADQQLRLGNVEEAITHLERSAGLADYCHAGGYEALGQAWLAAARARLDEADESEFDEPLAKAIAGRSRSGEALVRLHRAVTIAADGRPEEAFDDFEQAIALFESFGGLPNAARARHAYGQVLAVAGRTDESATHLREAEALFERLGINPEPLSMGA